MGIDKEYSIKDLPSSNFVVFVGNVCGNCAEGVRDYEPQRGITV